MKTDQSQLCSVCGEPREEHPSQSDIKAALLYAAERFQYDDQTFDRTWMLDSAEAVARIEASHAALLSALEAITTAVTIDEATEAYRRAGAAISGAKGDQP